MRRRWRDGRSEGRDLGEGRLHRGNVQHWPLLSSELKSWFKSRNPLTVTDFSAQCSLNFAAGEHALDVVVAPGALHDENLKTNARPSCRSHSFT